MNFPDHKGGLYLEHNPHKGAYETVEDHVQLYDDWDAFVSDEEEQKAIETQDFWSLQWYPDTPISSYKLLAHNLDVLLERALEVEKEYKNTETSNAGQIPLEDHS